MTLSAIQNIGRMVTILSVLTLSYYAGGISALLITFTICTLNTNKHVRRILSKQNYSTRMTIEVIEHASLTLLLKFLLMLIPYNPRIATHVESLTRKTTSIRKENTQMQVNCTSQSLEVSIFFYWIYEKIRVYTTYVMNNFHQIISNIKDVDFVKKEYESLLEEESKLRSDLERLESEQEDKSHTLMSLHESVEALTKELQGCDDTAKLDELKRNLAKENEIMSMEDVKHEKLLGKIVILKGRIEMISRRCKKLKNSLRSIVDDEKITRDD